MEAVNVRSDGRTVWVDVGMYTVGRFGRLGIDVHTRTADGCLHCTHEPTTVKDWHVFVEKIYEYHGVRVSHHHMPTRFRP